MLTYVAPCEDPTAAANTTVCVVLPVVFAQFQFALLAIACFTVHQRSEPSQNLDCFARSLFRDVEGVENCPRSGHRARCHFEPLGLLVS